MLTVSATALTQDWLFDNMNDTSSIPRMNRQQQLPKLQQASRNGILIGFQTDPRFEHWPGWPYVELAFAAWTCRAGIWRSYYFGGRASWSEAELPPQHQHQYSVVVAVLELPLASGAVNSLHLLLHYYDNCWVSLLPCRKMTTRSESSSSSSVAAVVAAVAVVVIVVLW